MATWVVKGAGKSWTIRKVRRLSSVRMVIVKAIVPHVPEGTPLEVTLWEKWQGMVLSPVTTRTFADGKWSAPISHDTRMCA